MKLFKITTWPSALVFLLAGGVAAIFAFVTVNLFAQAMASVRFIRQHGWVAVEHGVLWQVLELLFWGAMSLGCWLIFKICEHLLEDRYIAWSQRDHALEDKPVRRSKPKAKRKG